MQLQMTAPLDIGLELQDATLHNGQDDVFDLQHTEKQLRKKGGISRLVDETGSMPSDSEDEGTAMDEDDEAVLATEDERERKVAELEEELDGMYDAYQMRMKDKDTKYRVKEARRKDRSRDEWYGIHKKDSDDEENDESDEGGWEEMEEAKANDRDSDSDDETDFEDNPPAVSQRKRGRPDDPAIERQPKKARLSQTVPDPTLEESRASKIWFDQDIFAGMEPLQSDEEEEDIQDSDVEMDQDKQDEADSMDEGFEVVPQAPDVDENMWDVEDENVDEIKQAKIKSKFSHFPATRSR
jgi:AdoMet-dependent rRNA methyltransferase SPB1